MRWKQDGVRTLWQWCVPCALVAIALFGSVAPTQAESSNHPMYDDGGTLRWYSSLSEARKVAAREGKLILVDVSLPNCKTCEMVIGLVGDILVRVRLNQETILYHLRRGEASPEP